MSRCLRNMRQPVVATVIVFAAFSLLYLAMSSGVDSNAQQPRLSSFQNARDNTPLIPESTVRSVSSQSNVISRRKPKLESGVHVEQLMEKIARLEAHVAALEAQLEHHGVKQYPAARKLSYKERKRILVTGGAGFVGSHLVDKLLIEGHEVIAMDNFFTGRKRNVAHWIGHPHFELVHHDVVNPIYFEVDQIYHLASPASPPHYMYNPVKTIKTNTIGTINMLGLARRVKARVLLASTSEVYGDPEVHPQREDYWGHVNPIGPRSCYDEGKRVAEALMHAYHKQEHVDIRTARIFNTFGPRMHMNDGRVVSNFILQALRGEPVTIYGDGSQTRSFQYVSDLVDGLVALMNSNTTQPVNLGNPEEHSIKEFANIIKLLTSSNSEIHHVKAALDDPKQRRPDINRARTVLGWWPKVTMVEGLNLTIAYFRKEIEANSFLGGESTKLPGAPPLEHFE